MSYIGIISFIYFSTPIFANPIELIIPDEVSTIRGGGFPSLGFKVIDLVTIAPKFSTLTNSGISVP